MFPRLAGCPLILIWMGNWCKTVVWLDARLLTGPHHSSYDRLLRGSTSSLSLYRLSDFSTQTKNHTTTTTTTVLRPFFKDYPGEPVPEKKLLDFMVQGKINRGRHTDHPAGRHSNRTNQCPPPPSLSPSNKEKKHKKTLKLSKCTDTTTIQRQAFHRHYTGQPVLAGTPTKSCRILLELFYCLHSLADSNKHI